MTKKKAVKSRTKKAVKTRAQWAAEIRAAHKQSIEGILKMGRTLIAAKKALAHGTFEKMIEADLPFDASTAQRLMKISRDARLRKAAHGQLLPGSWRTLYELTKLSDEEFERAVTSGAINPAMTREQARYVTVKVTETNRKYPVVYYTKSEEPKATAIVPIYATDRDLPASTVGSKMIVDDHDVKDDTPIIDLSEYAALIQIERAVGELAKAIERSDVRTDAAFERRIRAVADRLLSLVDSEHTAMAPS